MKNFKIKLFEIRNSALIASFLQLEKKFKEENWKRNCFDQLLDKRASFFGENLAYYDAFHGKLAMINGGKCTF